MTRTRSALLTIATTLLVSGLLIGCGGAAAPAPTSAPQPAAKPAPTTAPAAPAPTKAAAPAPTKAAAPAPTKAAAPAPTQAPARAEGFFKDKTINLVIPNSAGRGNDTVLRYLLPSIQKAAGAKDIVVENLPGAGGALGFNKTYNAKPDGLNWGAGNPSSQILAQLSGSPGVQWEVTKFNFLARSYKTPKMIITPAKGGVKTVDEALKLGRPLNLPIQGLDDDNLSMFLIVNFLGLKGKLITGYQGESDVFLACLRGEGDWAGSSESTATPMIKDGDMVPVVLEQGERLKSFPDIPTDLEVVKDPAAKDALVAVNHIQELGLSFYLPPGVDPKIVAEARYVVEKALTSDPKLAAEMPSKTGGRELFFMKGEELQSTVAQIMSQGSKLVPVLNEAQESIK